MSGELDPRLLTIMGEWENALAKEARSSRNSVISVASEGSDLAYFGFSQDEASACSTRSQSRLSTITPNDGAPLVSQQQALDDQSFVDFAPDLETEYYAKGTRDPVEETFAHSSHHTSMVVDSRTNQSAAACIQSEHRSFTLQPIDQPEPEAFTTLGEWENALVKEARSSRNSVMSVTSDGGELAYFGFATSSQAQRRSIVTDSPTNQHATGSQSQLGSPILDDTTNQSAAKRIRSGRRSLLLNEVQHSEADSEVQPARAVSPSSLEQLRLEQLRLEELNQQLFKEQTNLLQTPKVERVVILDKISLLQTQISNVRQGTEQWLAYRKQVFQRPSITANIIETKSKYMTYATDHEIDQWSEMVHEISGSPKDGDSVQLTKGMQACSKAYAAGQYSEDERVRIQNSNIPSDLVQHTTAKHAGTLCGLQTLIKMLNSTPKHIQLLHRVLMHCELLPADATDHLVLPLLADVQTRMAHGSYLPQEVQWQLSSLLNAFLSFGISEATFEKRDTKPATGTEGLASVMVSPPRLAARFLEGVPPHLKLLKPTLDFYEKQTRSRMGINLQASQCIWGVSDLHTDCKANMVWLEQLPCCANDTILVAGDIATKIDIIRKSLELLVDKFQHVFYVPGNHDLWNVTGFDNSGSKFFALLKMCDELGVHTTAAFVGRVLVIPLFSWYKGGLAGLAEDDDPGMMNAFDMACQWPSYIAPESRGSLQPEIADFFAALNEEVLETVKRRDDTCAVISMSHFIPYKELFPGMVAMRHIMGCNEIATQVLEAGSDVHVFGHSHANIDNVVCGTRFIQAALGHPNDASYSASHQPKLLWDLDPALNAPMNNTC